ncbi:hypothetical protein BC830DRAFT_1154196 [Chytriomyces sp. MP71]|nr:hypothetical protein BC830DRAFT_1154196 [Chytriomyces sp. MP71]
MAAIRRTLNEEKEMDVLNVRVQLMSEKEEQLNQLKEQMDLEQQQSTSLLHDEIDGLKRAFSAERVSLKAEADALRNTVLHLQTELKSALKNTVTNSVDTCTQTEGRNDDELKETLRDVSHLFKLESPSALLSTVKSFLKQTQDNMDAYKQHIVKRDTQLRDLRAQLSDLHAQNKTWEQKHTSTLQTLQDAHESALSSLKESHQHQLSVLQEQSAHVLFQDFRREIDTVIDQQKAQIAKEAEGTLEKERIAMDDLVARQLDEQRERLHLQYEEVLRRSTDAVKKQCAVAYKEAVTRLKEEYTRHHSEPRGLAFMSW